MIISCSQAGIVNVKQPGQGIRDMKRAAFSDVFLDVSVYCSGYELENHGNKKLKKTKEILVSENPSELQTVMEPMLKKLADEKLQCKVAIAPYLCQDTKRKDLNGLIEKLVEESIKACGRIGCEYLVVRPLFAGIPESGAWEENRKYFLSLAPLARGNHVTILLENQCKDVNGHLVRGLCSDGENAAGWVDYKLYSKHKLTWQNGAKTVYVWGKDEFDNMTVVSTAGITLDARYSLSLKNNQEYLGRLESSSRYAIKADDGGWQWQDSSVFTNLVPVTVYTLKTQLYDIVGITGDSEEIKLRAVYDNDGKLYIEHLN